MTSHDKSVLCVQVETKKPAPRPNLRPVFKAKAAAPPASSKTAQEQQGPVESDPSQPHAKRAKHEEQPGSSVEKEQGSSQAQVNAEDRIGSKEEGGLAGLLGGYGSGSDSD